MGSFFISTDCQKFFPIRPLALMLSILVRVAREVDCPGVSSESRPDERGCEVS